MLDLDLEHMIRKVTYNIALLLSQDSDTKLSTLYMDHDTLATNKMQFDILNDSMGIFRLETTAFEDDSFVTKYTAYHNSELQDFFYIITRINSNAFV